jgi:transcriptional regulator with XRE-family HTH domain
MTLAPPLDPAWWETPEMRAALAKRDIRAVYRCLLDHGWSQSAIAARTGQTQPEVSEFLRSDRQVITYPLLERIATAFSIPRGYMGLAYAEDLADFHTEEPEEDPMLRRQLLGVTASLAVGAAVPDLWRWLPAITPAAAPVPRRIGADDVAQIRAVTASLSTQDNQYGGGAALDAATGYLRWVSRLLSASYTDQTSIQLRIALADLHSLTGWALHDLGRHVQAKKHFVQALTLARDTDDPGLVAAMLYRLGRVSLHQEHPVDALRIFDLGQIAAHEAGSHPEIARMHLNQAWAYALLGQTRQVADSLARAEHERGLATAADEETSWAAEILVCNGFDGVAGLTYCLLSRHAAATGEAAERAVDIARRLTAGPTMSTRPGRARVFDQIMYAASLLRAGDRASGLDAAHHAVSHVEELLSVRAVDRLTDIASAATAWPADPDAREIRHRIAALQAAA